MADTDDKTPQGEVKNDQNDGGEGNDTEQKVTINGQEMTLAEAAELVASGKEYKELREQYSDIDFKELPRSFTQTRQELADLKGGKKDGSKDLPPDEAKRVEEIERFFADPLVQQKLIEVSDKKAKELSEDLQFQKVLESLEAEFDGSDGRPKFNRAKVLEHGKKINVFNPRVAYKDLHEKELEEWAINQRISKKRPTTSFDRGAGSGGKQPEPTTAKSLSEATAQALQTPED